MRGFSFLSFFSPRAAWGRLHTKWVGSVWLDIGGCRGNMYKSSRGGGWGWGDSGDSFGLFSRRWAFSIIVQYVVVLFLLLFLTLLRAGVGVRFLISLLSGIDTLGGAPVMGLLIRTLDM
jgi:hypothetical protein